MEESFNPLDIRDLQILLDNPQKHVTPFETYVSYRVTTKVHFLLIELSRVGIYCFLFLIDYSS